MLVSWARESLKPLVDAKYPEALWLFCSIPSGEHRSEEEFDRQHMIQVRAAAEAGSASARFHLACELDAEPTIQESAELFKAAAEQGHSYSKWCHGLNLLSGRGIEKNEALGLRYIEDAANSKFEGAIQFLCNAYTNGTYGYPKDAEVAASWWAKLKDKDVIPF
jgi:TPR repeat protein